MKLSKEAVLEVVAIFQDGLMGNRDASQALRDLDFAEDGGCLVLSGEYLRDHPRGGTWLEEPDTEKN